MSLTRVVAARPGVVSGAVGFAVGLFMGRVEVALLAAIFCFFAGKSLQSMLWTFGADSRHEA